MELRPSAGRVPARALTSSSLLHIAVGMTWILLLPALAILFPFPEVQPERVNLKKASVSLYLPALGARASGSGQRAAAGSRSKGAASDSRPASTKTGFTFLGPQPIISEIPHHDNLIQTINQPDIPNAPKLKMPIVSPNILQMAAPSAPQLAPQQKVVEMAQQVSTGQHIPVRPRTSETVPRAKLTLPQSGDLASRSVNSLMTATRDAPKLAAVPPPPPPVPGEGTDRRNLMVLNAMPAAIPPPAIPAGELAGNFSVSPEGNPGTHAGTVTATSPGSGVNGSSAGAANGKPPGTASGSGAASSGQEGTGGSIAGLGTGAGLEHGGSGGDGSGTGSDSGPAGRGSGSVGVANGSGGTGNSSFPGVSIGSAPPAVSAASAPPRAAVPHGTYAMTIVASSNSGGGLGDYGIFKNEVVYTVYIDVADPDHARPKWTLQYAALVPAASNVIAPFPTTREYPHLPAQALARNIGRKLVVTGTIDKDGKLAGLRVIQSPNPLLIQPLIECLAKWSFQAAESNGEQLPVKFVLGIPITAELLNVN